MHDLFNDIMAHCLLMMPSEQFPFSINLGKQFYCIIEHVIFHLALHCIELSYLFPVRYKTLHGFYHL